MRLLKWLFRIAFVLVLFVSLALNVGMFIGGALYDVASSAISSVTDRKTVAMQAADDLSSAKVEAAEQRAVNSKLRQDVSEATDDLAKERIANRKLRSELNDALGDVALERTTTYQLREQLQEAPFGQVRFRGEKVPIKEAVNITSDRISQRAAKTSAREVSSMAAEAIPYVGIAVIVGATAWELKDLCDTLKDMTELRRAFEPDSDIGEEELTVCAQQVPTGEEVWETVKSSPKSAWKAAMDAMPTMDEVKQWDLPDVDLERAGDSAKDMLWQSWTFGRNSAENVFENARRKYKDWVDGGDAPLSEDEESGK